MKRVASGRYLYSYDVRGSCGFLVGKFGEDWTVFEDGRDQGGISIRFGRSECHHCWRRLSGFEVA